MVDDDTELCELVAEVLVNAGINVEVANDGGHGLRRALSGEHDILLLDVKLPEIDGFEILKLVRRQRNVPIIMLTALITSRDQLTGFDAGTDDYLMKPFQVDLLLARIRAVLRRSRVTADSQCTVAVGRVRISRDSRKAFVDDNILQLTSVEFGILDYLAGAVGRVVPRSELTLAIFNRKKMALDRALDTHICNLRRKIACGGISICTVRGIGYQLSAPDEIDQLRR
jgi:DNA-binding response OmpR family regulator